jgi:hypothetical protein
VKLDFDDLIEHGVECEYLDFKLIDTTFTCPAKTNEFIKDVIALANSDYPGDKHIIIGVKIKDAANRELVGINPQDLKDNASYQQILREYVEPDIGFNIQIHQHDTKSFGIMTIKGLDRPYVCKKDKDLYYDYRLEKGDIWIRKGSHKPRVVRRDLDEIYKEKFDSRPPESNQITLYFPESNSDTIDVNSVNKPELPSEHAIRNMEASAKELDTGNSTDDRSIRLERIISEYEEDDNYVLFVENGYRFQCKIRNDGQSFLEKTMIYFSFPIMEGLHIAQKMPDPIDRESKDNKKLRLSDASDANYPMIEISSENVTVIRRLDDVRHGFSTYVFYRQPLIYIDSSLTTSIIEISVKIHAKNLRKPMEKKLKIRVLPPI